MGWVVNATPRPPYPRQGPGTHCIGGWVGPHGRSGRVLKISPSPGFDPRTVQPVDRPVLTLWRSLLSPFLRQNVDAKFSPRKTDSQTASCRNSDDRNGRPRPFPWDPQIILCGWYSCPRSLGRGPAAARLRVWTPSVALVCVLCVVYCQLEVSATSRSLVQRIPTDWMRSGATVTLYAYSE
jgi:hypothetical protein